MNLTTIEPQSHAARMVFPPRPVSCLPTLFSLAGLAFFFCIVASPAVHGAPINYGSFTGNTVHYVDVTEDSNSGDTLPLFGVPIVTGDSIDFNPVGFDANATNGSVDITDSNLSFAVHAKPGFAINNINLDEAGDTTMAGFGNDSTVTSVTADGALNIFEVDGMGISVISRPISLVFTPSNGDYKLLTDGGGGPLFHTQWSGSLFLNIAQILTQEGQPFVTGATKISINIDNTLTAVSQVGTTALIAKKDFGGVSITVNRPPSGEIPEPATAALVLSAVLGLFLRRQAVR
jgi:hypothetical protein